MGRGIDPDSPNWAPIILVVLVTVFLIWVMRDATRDDTKPPTTIPTTVYVVEPGP